MEERNTARAGGDGAAARAEADAACLCAPDTQERAEAGAACRCGARRTLRTGEQKSRLIK